MTIQIYKLSIRRRASGASIRRTPGYAYLVIGMTMSLGNARSAAKLFAQARIAGQSRIAAFGQDGQGTNQRNRFIQLKSNHPGTIIGHKKMFQVLLGDIRDGKTTLLEEALHNRLFGLLIILESVQ